MGGDITPVGIMWVLRTFVQESLLGDLVDKEVQEDADEESLVERIADHVIGLVVDTMQLLKALEIAGSGGSVRDGPKTKMVHVAQHGPAMLEGNIVAFFLLVVVLVHVSRLAHVSHVRGFINEVLSRGVEESKLVLIVHFLSNFFN